MNNLIKNQSDFTYYELAASTNGKEVRIYGQTLEDICDMYISSIGKFRYPEQKAIERGKYARFILDNIYFFSFRERIQKLKLVLKLTECGIEVLGAALNQNSKKSLYHINIEFMKECRKEAILLLNRD